MKLSKIKFYKYLGYIVLFAFSLYICYKTIQTQKKIKEGMTNADKKTIDDYAAPMKVSRKKCKARCIKKDKGDKDDCVVKCYDKCITKCPVSWDSPMLPYPEPNCSDKSKYPDIPNKRACQDFKAKMNYAIKDCKGACGMDPNPYPDLDD
jgi:hypothetical protein